MRSGATRKVGGLPTSCRSAPQARVRGRAWRELREQKQGVDKDVAFGVELRGLLDAFHVGDLGQDLDEKIGFIQKFECAAGLALGQHFGELVADALAADGVNARGELANGGERVGFDGVAEARGEADGAQQTKLIFVEAAVGIADGADEPRVEIGQAVDVIEESFAHGGRL